MKDLDSGTGNMRIIALSAGNSRLTFAPCEGREIRAAQTMPTDQVEEAARAIGAMCSEHDADAIVMATVNRSVSDALVASLRAKIDVGVYTIGTDIGMPNAGGVDPDAKTGQDRLLAALAAFESLQQACVVVDAGTAITVDFVDGEGVFQGGAIAPGMRMGLEALSARTDGLPEVEFVSPMSEAFGKNTNQAMINGVFFSARGLVRALTERYAEAYEAYPLVVATGGDAQILFEDDDLVDRIVPDLVLRGIALACEKSLAVDHES